MRNSARRLSIAAFSVVGLTAFAALWLSVDASLFWYSGAWPSARYSVPLTAQLAGLAIIVVYCAYKLVILARTQPETVGGVTTASPPDPVKRVRDWIVVVAVMIVGVFIFHLGGVYSTFFIGLANGEVFWLPIAIRLVMLGCAIAVVYAGFKGLRMIEAALKGERNHGGDTLP